MCFLYFVLFFASADIFVFLLSTRAGGLGINLTAADTVRLAQVYYLLYQATILAKLCTVFFNKKDLIVFLPFTFFRSPSLRSASQLLCGVCGTKLTETLSRQEDLNTRVKEGRAKREGRKKCALHCFAFWSY